MPTTSEPFHAAAVHLLTGWTAPSADQDTLRRDYLHFLSEHPDGLHRQQRAGHLTASALIVDPTRQVVSAVVWDYTPILDDAIVETSAALDAITAAYPAAVAVA